MKKIMPEYFYKLLYLLSRKDKNRIVVLSFLMLISTLMELIGIGIIPLYVLVILDPQKLASIPVIGQLAHYLDPADPERTLIIGGVILLIVFILKSLIISYFYYQKGKVLYDIKVKLEKELFNTYVNNPYLFHLRNNSATLIRNLTQEIPIIVINVLFPLVTLMNGILMVVSIITLLLIVNPFITLIVILLIGGGSLAFYRMITKKIRKYGHEAQLQRDVAIRVSNHALGGIKEINVFNTQPYFINRFFKSSLISARAMMFRQFMSQVNKPILETLAISGVVIIAFGLYIQNTSSAEVAAILTLFAAAMVRLMPSAREILTDLTGLKYNVVAIEPVYEHIHAYRNQQEHAAPSEEHDEALEFHQKISLNNISFKYPETDTWVLDRISLEILKNQVIGIAGPTGGGKTTLIDAMMGLILPQNGNIMVDGKDISISLKKWKSKIGYVPQFIFLTDDSIKNNIAFGIDEDKIDRQKLDHAIRAAQLESFIQKLPDRENTIIGERGVRLSGGQRQRIGIARALYHEPDILIFDEATSSLDNVTEKNLVNAIDTFKDQKTIIIVAHRLSTIKKCNAIFVLKDGKITGSGSYDELLRSNDDFKKLAQP